MRREEEVMSKIKNPNYYSHRRFHKDRNAEFLTCLMCTMSPANVTAVSNLLCLCNRHHILFIYDKTNVKGNIALRPPKHMHAHAYRHKCINCKQNVGKKWTSAPTKMRKRNEKIRELSRHLSLSYRYHQLKLRTASDLSIRFWIECKTKGKCVEPNTEERASLHGKSDERRSSRV